MCGPNGGTELKYGLLRPESSRHEVSAHTMTERTDSKSDDLASTEVNKKVRLGVAAPYQTHRMISRIVESGAMFERLNTPHQQTWAKARLGAEELSSRSVHAPPLPSPAFPEPNPPEQVCILDGRLLLE